MASINLTIPDAALPRVVAALCADADLPVSNANAKQAVINWVKETVKKVEYTAAMTARPAVPDPDVSSIVT